MHQLNRKQSYCNLYHSANSISYHTMLIMILNKLTKITFAIARRLCLCSIQNEAEGKPLPAPGLAAPNTNNSNRGKKEDRDSSRGPRTNQTNRTSLEFRRPKPAPGWGSNKAKNLSSDDGP